VKTIGEGFLATFDGPARAIRCACAVRDGVRSPGLDIRAGLHAGQCELMGDHVGGIETCSPTPSSGSGLCHVRSRFRRRADREAVPKSYGEAEF
jgi:hypothetical protein